jgi:demethylmenaquinone methyltransferase/2-methoxy-6-polyprenyl-1,4-benzoquinol methylase
VVRAPHPVLPRYYKDHDQRHPFVIELFDGAASYYDRVCRLMSLGSGQWYRRWTLERLGLAPGMRVLDVATGTALVARAALDIVKEPAAVVGLDPSAGMLAEARKHFAGRLAQGRVEELPFADARFDLLTIGYALRHAADLDVALGECLRVLKPGGRLLILEISRPASTAQRGLIRFHLTRVLPWAMRLCTRNRHAHLLMRYYWDTIVTCVPPETVLEALQRTGFAEPRRTVLGGLLSEYTALKPRPHGSA